MLRAFLDGGVHSDNVKLLNTDDGLRRGIWTEQPPGLPEALTNLYRKIAQSLDPRPNQWILDAGGGVGGAALWLASHYQVHFVALASSLTQLQLGTSRAVGLSLNRVEFRNERPHDVRSCQPGTFHGAYAIESFSRYYHDLPRVLNEMRRLLVPRGRLIISDLVLRRPPADHFESALLHEFLAGYKLLQLVEFADITTSLVRTGFQVSQVMDMALDIGPSVRAIDREWQRKCRWWTLASNLNLLPPDAQLALRALCVQKKLYDSGLLGYTFISAVRLRD